MFFDVLCVYDCLIKAEVKASGAAITSKRAESTWPHGDRRLSKLMLALPAASHERSEDR